MSTTPTHDHISEAIKFINAYRTFEKIAYTHSDNKIRIAIKNERMAEHLVSSWHSRKKDFSSFYLNLGHTTQNEFLSYWGIAVDGAGEYAYENENNPMTALWLSPPPTTEWLHELMKIFYNHGINKHFLVVVGDEKFTTELPKLPSKNKRFGNSKNWGDYILSLPSADQKQVLDFFYSVAQATINRKS